MLTKHFLRLLAGALLLLAPLPFRPAPVSADILTSADVRLVPQPDADVIAFGLQAVRIQADQKFPITGLDVLAGQRKLSRFSPADQAYVRTQFHRYQAAPLHVAGDLNPQTAAKTTLPPPDLSAQKLWDSSVNFILHPYLEIAPAAHSLQDTKNDIVAYGQPVNVNSLRFAEFLRSLSPNQKTNLLHGSSLTVGDLNSKQRLFVSDLWQASSHPECVKFCSSPDTQVTVGFYLEAVVEQSVQGVSTVSHVQLPQPATGRDLFVFHDAEGQQGQVWMRF